jgi:poly(3-hydroxyalkanoate) depolymerase
MTTSTGTLKGRTPEYSLLNFGGRKVRAAFWRLDAPGKAGKDRPRPILFFNGIGANIELMEPMAEWFPDREIVTFDMPGVGLSPTGLLPYRPWMIARFSCQVLDHYGIDVADVMGVSWGGGMAQQFAFQHPRRTGRLLLAATSAGMLMVPGDPAVLASMASPRRYMDKDYMLENFAKLYGGDTKGKSGHALRLKPPSIMGYMQQLTCMIGWTSAWFLPFLRAPTLIMMGDADKIVPVANGHILKALAANAELYIVPGGGHLFLVSQAEKVAPVMKEFFDRGEVWAGGADVPASKAAASKSGQTARAKAPRARKPANRNALATA